MWKTFIGNFSWIRILENILRYRQHSDLIRHKMGNRLRHASGPIHANLSPVTYIFTTWVLNQSAVRYRDCECTLSNRNTVTIWIPDTMGIQYLNGSHVTWPIIWIPDILDHNQDFFSPVFRPPFESWTIWRPDTNLPFKYRTSPAFRWLLLSFFCRSLNRLIRPSYPNGLDRFQTTWFR